MLLILMWKGLEGRQAGDLNAGWRVVGVGIRVGREEGVGVLEY